MDLLELGLSKYDIALLILCPASAAIGSFAFAINATISEMPPKEESKTYFVSEKLQKARGAWLFLRILLGAIMGLFLGLYFVGSIQESPSTIAKIVALSLLFGYAAPKIWLAQDKVIASQVEKIMKKELSKLDD